MSKNFNTRITHKIDTYSHWELATNFIPLAGEIIVYTPDDENDTRLTQIKIGDGKTYVNDLKFLITGSSTGYFDDIQSDWLSVNKDSLNYIKNKPGDTIVTETITPLTTISTDGVMFDIEIDNLIYYAYFNVDFIPEVGQTISVKISISGNSYVEDCNVFHVSTDGDAVYTGFLFNCLNTGTLPDISENGWKIVDENKPYFIGIYRTDKSRIYFYTPSDTYSGSTFIIGNKNIEIENIKLPYEYIKNKPGDVSGEIITKEHIVNLENIQNFSYEEDGGCYLFQNGDVFYEETLSGKEVKVSVRRPTDSESIIYDANVVIPDEEYPEEAFIFVNTTVSDAGEWLEGGFPKIDETLPTFIFMTQGYIYASEDLTGYDIEIYTENIETDYVKLPYEYISNKPGDITTTKTTLSETIQLPSDQYNSSGISYWMSNFPNIITIGDNITVQISLSDNTYEQECEVQEFQEDMIIFNFNCTEDPNTAVSNGIIKIDGNMPAFIVVYRVDSAQMYLYSYDNCDGATLTIVKSVLNSTSIKLPNNAINIDVEPTEGSTNFINSGDLYNIIGDIDTAISQLETMIGGASS